MLLNKYVYRYFCEGIELSARTRHSMFRRPPNTASWHSYNIQVNDSESGEAFFPTITVDRHLPYRTLTMPPTVESQHLRMQAVLDSATACAITSFKFKEVFLTSESNVLSRLIEITPFI